jgi:Acetyltransferase (GNAT) domain
MAGFADKVLMIVEAEKSAREIVKRAYRQLVAVNPKVAVILNKSRSYGPKMAGSVGIGSQIKSRSAMELNRADPLDPKWDELVLSHPQYSVFHSSAWAKVLCKTYHHRPFYFSCCDANHLEALVPMIEVQSPFTGRRGICLPFTDFCDPLLFRESSCSALIKSVSALARERQWKYFEFRGGVVSTLTGRPVPLFYGHRLDLRCGAEKLYCGLPASFRRNLRKAKDNGITHELSHTREAVEAFYRLHTRTRRRHGIPPQPVSFFWNIYNELIKPRLGFVALARKNSEPIAASVYFHFGKKAVYKFGASDERLKHLQANTLVQWNAISFLAETGMEELHLGRTDADNPGLRRFKLGWGTTEEVIQYCKYQLATDRWVSDGAKKYNFHKTLFSRLPLAVNRLAGAILYPHLD